MDHRGIWIIAEQEKGHILRVSHELLTRARVLADKRNTELTAVLMGHGITDDELNDLIARGADRVLYVCDEALQHFDAEPYAACLQALVEEQRPEAIIAGATTSGRTLMPYVAVRLHTGLTADCTELDIDPETGGLLQTRPAIGGNIMATIQTPVHRPQMATVRPRSAKPAPAIPGRTGNIIQIAPKPKQLTSRVKRIGFIPDSSTHNLQDADIVVSVGRGVRRAESLQPIRDLADALGAAVGASREVVDRGWLSYPHQVGLSGKTVTPKAYIAIGISGAIQHLAGMQTAETIIAINSDPDAQIFKIAELGIVGDLFEVVPALTKALNAMRDGA